MSGDPVAASLARPAPLVEPELLGWRLTVHGVSGIIAETEAYQGEEDLACHAAKGRTPRTATLYCAPGTLYVYLCYGMHWMLNVDCPISLLPPQKPISNRWRGTRWIVSQEVV